MAKLNKFQEKIQPILDQYFQKNRHDEVLNKIKKDGTLSWDDLTAYGLKQNGADNAVMKDLIEGVTGGKPVTSAGETYTKEELQGLALKDQKTGKALDPSALSDAELAHQRDLVDTLGSSTGNIDRASIQRALDTKFNDFGIKDANREAIISQITDTAMKLGHYPSAQELKDQFAKDQVWSHSANKQVSDEGGKLNTGQNIIDKSTVSGIPGATDNNEDLYVRKGYLDPSLENFFNDQGVRNELSNLIDTQVKAPDTTDQLKALQDVIDTRKTAADRETTINDFLGSIPGELKAGTDARAQDLQRIGGKQFEQLTPQILARENALGRLHSGSVGDVLSSTAGDIQGRIESEISNQQTQDLQFYFNAAYQNQIRKLAEGTSDLNTNIATERQNVRLGQETRFQNTQYDLNANNSTDLLMKRYQDQLNANKLNYQNQNNLRNSNASAAGWAGVGSGAVMGGATGFAMGGGLPGAGIGAAIGAGGAAIPLVFGKQA